MAEAYIERHYGPDCPKLSWLIRYSLGSPRYPGFEVSLLTTLSL